MNAIAKSNNLPRYDERRMFSKSRGRVTQYSFKNNLPSLMIQADCVIFINRGQNYVVIDDMFVLAPGGTMKERNVTNDYQFEFVTNASPPVADGQIVKSGNYLAVRLLNGDGDVDCDIVMENPASISTGDITVDITPATPATQNAEWALITATATVPNSAGAFKVVVTNVSGTESALFVNIDVNGETVAPGGSITFEVYLDNTTNTQYFCPEVDVTIPADGAARYAVIYP